MNVLFSSQVQAEAEYVQRIWGFSSMAFSFLGFSFWFGAMVPRMLSSVSFYLSFSQPFWYCLVLALREKAIKMEKNTQCCFLPPSIHFSQVPVHVFSVLHCLQVRFSILCPEFIIITSRKVDLIGVTPRLREWVPMIGLQKGWNPFT